MPGSVHHHSSTGSGSPRPPWPSQQLHPHGPASGTRGYGKDQVPVSHDREWGSSLKKMIMFKVRVQFYCCCTGENVRYDEVKN